ncbi:MAG: glycosyltransferase [Candidatus Aureabacteria bacterium]|nr:glycosyltransferase [Candidatus Auribacterota bacterium]
MKKMVSVCMITCNHAKFIEEAINGVLSQKTKFDIELVIGEDCSSDNTRDIVHTYAEKYPFLIRVFTSEKNVGVINNFTRTLKVCTGKYIALCEGDDYWSDPYKLQKQVDFLEANPEFSLCFHKVKILKEDGNLVNDFRTKAPKRVTTLKDLARRGNYIHTPSVVLRNDFQIPGWFLNCPIGDYPLYFLAVRDKKIKYMPTVMAVYRHGVGVHSSASLYVRRTNMFLSVNEIIKNYSDRTIIEILQKTKRRTLHCLLSRYFFGNEGTIDEINLVLSNYYGSTENPLYYFASDLIKNWPYLVFYRMKLVISKIIRRIKSSY